MGSGRFPNPSYARTDGLGVGAYGLKPAFRRALRPLLAWACRFHPNTVSLFAVLCAAAAGLSLWGAAYWPWLVLVVPPLLFARIAFNALDGMVAQERGMASRRGELVNESSDRLNDALILGGLAASQVPDVALTLGALAAILLVSYLGILPKAAGGPRLYGGPGGKADRMAVVGLGCILAYAVPMASAVTARDVWGWTLAALIALACVTAILRWARAWRVLEGAT